MGRKKKYQTAAALKKAVDGYFASISYRVPAVVSTPTGEVDEKGGVQWKTKLLTEGTDGTGKPKTVVRYLKPPGLAGLCLHLGISRETWSNYGQDGSLRDVVEDARMRVEDYWGGELAGKGAQGAKFALSSNFGWSGAWTEKQEITHRGSESVEEYLLRLEKAGERQAF